MAAKRILGDLDELELLPWYDNRDLTGYALVILEPSDGSLKTQLKDVSIAGKVVVVSDMIYGSHLVSALLKNGIQAERVAYNDLSTYYLTPNP